MRDIDALADPIRHFLPDTPGRVYLVGGAVRDLLAGRMPADIDLVVEGDAALFAGRIAGNAGGRVIDLGKKGGAVLRVASPAAIIDITLLAHPSIEANLLERDFTINAMAYDVKARRLVDCAGGQADLRHKKIRMVSPAVFEKDPARLVRAYRMAALFDGSITAATADAIARYRHLVGSVAGERVWAELVRLFDTPASAPLIRDMAASGLLTAIFPELQAAIGCTQNRHHQFDVFEHSLRAVETLEHLLAGFNTRFAHLAAMAGQSGLHDHKAMLTFAALLHDVGKPATRQIDRAGRVRFSGHAAKSADIAMEISRRLRLSNRQGHVADAIIRNHIRPLFLFLASQKGSLGRLGRVRFFNRCGDLTLPIVVHAMADIMAKADLPGKRDSDFIAFCEELFSAYIACRHTAADVPPLISGKDLIAVFGLSPSPQFRHILNRVDERRLCGELTTRDQALAWVANHLLAQKGNRRPAAQGPHSGSITRRSKPGTR